MVEVYRPRFSIRLAIPAVPGINVEIDKETWEARGIQAEETFKAFPKRYCKDDPGIDRRHALLHPCNIDRASYATLLREPLLFKKVAVNGWDVTVLVNQSIRFVRFLDPQKNP